MQDICDTHQDQIFSSDSEVVAERAAGGEQGDDDDDHGDDGGDVGVRSPLVGVVGCVVIVAWQHS